MLRLSGSIVLPFPQGKGSFVILNRRTIDPDPITFLSRPFLHRKRKMFEFGENVIYIVT